MIWLDFETRSRVNLKTAGAYKYAADDSTEAICLSWAVDDTDPVELWWPDLDAVPRKLLHALLNTDDFLAAHNAGFDRLIWNSENFQHNFAAVGGCIIDTDRWYCTAAQARVNALPSSLDDLTRCILDERYRKDHRGTALIKKLSIPQADGSFCMDDDALELMGDYCVTDTEIMREASLKMRPLSDDEHYDWVLNEDINDRGIRIDRFLASSATGYAATETEEIARLLHTLTDGSVSKHTQSARIKEWLLPQLCAVGQRIVTVYKKDVKKVSLDANARGQLLDALDAGELELTDAAAEVIQLVSDGNKSSVSKFKRMIERADDADDRVRGAFMFAGASQTLRFASRGLQLHNFRRECYTDKETELLVSKMTLGQPLDNVMNTLSKLLRPALIPARGHAFVVGDWAAIEGRGLPWLANSKGAEKVLDIFRNDEDLYLHTCTDIGLGHSDEERQIGKVVALSLGYGGANGAFYAMARNYGVSLPEHQVTAIVERWRDKNRWAVKFWRALEDAARNAVRNPYVEFSAGRITYVFIPELLDGTLVCGIAGQMTIQYPRARLEEVDGKFGPQIQLTAIKAGWKPAADQNKWPRVGLWRGLLAENVTQAFCGLLLRRKLCELSELNQPVVADVHDEIILEVPVKEAEDSRSILKEVMEAVPEWATGLPLKAKPVILSRYGKH